MPGSTSHGSVRRYVWEYGGPRYGLHRGNEPMPSPREGFDVPRCSRVVAERVPDLLDGEVETMFKIYNDPLAPDLVADLFPRYQLGGAADEQGEHPSGLRRQMDERACFPQLSRLEV